MNKKTNGYGLSRMHTSKPAAAKTKNVQMPKINSKKVGKRVQSGLDSTVSLIELPFLIVMGIINMLIAVLSMFAGDKDE